MNDLTLVLLTVSGVVGPLALVVTALSGSARNYYRWGGGTFSPPESRRPARLKPVPPGWTVHQLVNGCGDICVERWEYTG